MRRFLFVLVTVSLGSALVSAQPSRAVPNGTATSYNDGPHVYYPVQKFGFNLDIDTGSDPEDVTSIGGVYAGWLTVADTIDVVSTVADDSSGGSGATIVTVYGLNASWIETSEQVTLDGTTEVPLTTLFVRIHRARVDSAGSGSANAGIIRIATTTENTILAEIPVGYNQTEMAVYTIPASRTGLLYGWDVCTQKTGAATTAVFHIEAQDPTYWVWRVIDTVTLVSNVKPCYEGRYAWPIQLPEKTGIRVRVEETSADNLGVHAGLDILLMQ